MQRALLVAAVPLAACGRFDFTPVVAADAAGDGAGMQDDASSGDALAGVCGTGFLVCDLFETPLDTTRWNDTGGTITRDTTIAHRGTSSMRFTMPNAPANVEIGVYIGHSGPEIQAASQLWIRAWMRMTALPLSTNALEMIGVEQTGGTGDYLFVRSGDTQLFHQIDNAAGSAGAPPPLNTWFCLTWHIVFATGATGSSQVTSDVVPMFSIGSTVTQDSPAMDLVAFGPYFAATNLDVMQPAFDAWVDDVIIDDQPVTCAD